MSSRVPRNAFVVAAALFIAPYAYAQTPAVRVLGIAANDLAYDTVRNTLWASIDSANAPHSVVPIDATTGQAGAGLPFAQEPGELAISEDGAFLYVSFTASPEIHRVALATRTTDLVFSLAPAVHGPVAAEDIEVLPGDAHAVAIVTKYVSNASPRFVRLAVYDDGIARSAVAGGGNRIGFDSRTGLLLAFSNEARVTSALSLRVDATGVTELDELPYAALDGLTRDAHVADGQLVTSDGVATDTLALRRSGYFLNHPATNAVLIDPSIRAVLFPMPGGLLVFDRVSFVLRSQHALASVAGVAESAVRLGPGKIAFRTRNAQVAIVDLQISPADSDRDGVVDAHDNCASAANLAQADDDADGRGDACDSTPRGALATAQACRSTAASARAALPGVLASLAQCEAAGYPDMDGDVEPDARDLCPATGAGQLVDGGGCSQAQFCARIPAASCRRGDFGNDEPGIKRPGDCALTGSACGAP